MNWLVRKFKIWRRAPFKRVVMNAYSKGLLNSREMHEILGAIDRV